MSRLCRVIPKLLIAAAVLPAGGPRSAPAQLFGPFSAGSRFELAEGVQLDRADSTVLGHLERVDAYLADRQWDEAVETLRSVMENSPGKLLGVTGRRYVGLRDCVHLRLAALPPEALKLYRSRVDPVARKWCQEGIARRDRRLLLNVVEQAFASSWGDDALLALGEIALESGDHAAARWYWERIVPADLPEGTPPTWPGYPDTDLSLADVRARLVLVSILEGSAGRARKELAQFTRLHGDARGRLGGREVNYAEALGTLLTGSAAWPRPKPDADWTTFAGSPQRNKVAPALVDVGKVAWRISLPKIAAAGRSLGGSDLPPAVVAEDAEAVLSYHPVLVGDLVLVGTLQEILAVRLATGKPAWGEAAAAIYRDQLQGLGGPPALPLNTLGVPRMTMTASGGKLYARMGSPLTGRPQRNEDVFRSGHLVCVDLDAEGRLVWKIEPEEGWALEGSPVTDGTSVYVAMRRSDIRPQAHVACFDARTGRRRWRRFVCGAETPARGMLHQCTHNLLSLRRETLYYNTNLGAVAALCTRDGRLLWVSLYPRSLRGDLLRPAPHWQRDLNPCLVDRGTLLVAPADSPRIFAFDAAGGQILWQTGPQVAAATHLLGTTDKWLIAGGGKLYWISLDEESPGRVKHVWPDGLEQPGFGRGLLAGDRVLWPTREKIYIFDARTASPKKVIELLPRGVTGGNLLVAGGRLLIATGHELIALEVHGGKAERTGQTVGRAPVPRTKRGQVHFVRSTLRAVPAKCTCPLFVPNKHQTSP